MNFSAMTLRLIKLSLILLTCAAVSACSPTVTNHGNFPDRNAVAELKPGISRREDVRESLGSPSTISTFNDNTWYYVSRRTSRFAFYQAKNLRQTVLAIKFDNTGVYRAAKAYSFKDGRIINPNSRTTPTTGREVTFLEQMFGNLGRFTGDEAAKNEPDLFR
jgi:outer membrane protein assembly factor BamE (lipoprotein component of BamABCDE complex)